MPAFIVRLGEHQLELLNGDITAIPVDAIVNAANSELAGGGGVDGAIHRVGGREIMRELDTIRARIGRCETGSAVATGAGRLPAKYVFHAVGPVYRDGKHGEAALLESCYTACLRLAAERNLRTISFPSISTGVYGYPIDEAAAIAVRTVAEWLNHHTGPVDLVKLVQFSLRDNEIYRSHAEKIQQKLTAGTHGYNVSG
jgi:O-acetyl-ADP-ribose deacetylase (regulator of RNase III)